MINMKVVAVDVIYNFELDKCFNVKSMTGGGKYVEHQIFQSAIIFVLDTSSSFLAYIELQISS